MYVVTSFSPDGNVDDNINDDGNNILHCCCCCCCCCCCYCCCCCCCCPTLIYVNTLRRTTIENPEFFGNFQWVDSEFAMIRFTNKLYQALQEDKTNNNNTTKIRASKRVVFQFIKNDDTEHQIKKTNTTYYNTNLDAYIVGLLQNWSIDYLLSTQIWRNGQLHLLYIVQL